MMSKQLTVETIMFKGLEERWSNNVKIVESIVKTVIVWPSEFRLTGTQR